MLRPRQGLRAAPLAALYAALALLAIALGGCSDDASALITPSPTPAETADATRTPRVTAPRTPTPAHTQTPTPTPEPTPDPTPVVRSIRELISQFGEPPGATFARLRIPVLGLNAPVRAYDVDDLMIAPPNPVEVAWYDLSDFPGTGGAPGAGGNAIFSGHVDYAAHIGYAGGMMYRGGGVFAGLSLLSPGDVIEVEYGGDVLRYQVTWRREVSASGGDWGSIWSSDVPVDSITLYTCGGDFDPSTRTYDRRVVVRAERM